MRRRFVALGAAALLVIGYAATGCVVVGNGEVVVVRRLGRVLPELRRPGLHLGWPYGFDRAIRVRTDAVRRLEVGLAGTPGPDDDPGAGEFMTGSVITVDGGHTVSSL